MKWLRFVSALALVAGCRDDIAGFVPVNWCGTAACGPNEIEVNDVFTSMKGLIRIASQKIQFAITRDSDLQLP